jgi:hypothetical protein
MTQPWDNVEHSMASAPGANSEANTPSAPNQIAREAASSATMQNTASAPAQAAPGLPANRAPRLTTGSAFVAVRL